jgi:hypothetical protein
MVYIVTSVFTGLNLHMVVLKQWIFNPEHHTALSQPCLDITNEDHLFSFFNNAGHTQHTPHTSGKHRQQSIQRSEQYSSESIRALRPHHINLYRLQQTGGSRCPVLQKYSLVWSSTALTHFACERNQFSSHGRHSKGRSSLAKQRTSIYKLTQNFRNTARPRATFRCTTNTRTAFTSSDPSVSRHFSSIRQIANQVNLDLHR